MNSSYLLYNNTSFPQSFPITQPGRCQLCQHDFWMMAFHGQGTVPPPATEKGSALLREAQYLLELFVTLVGLQKGYKNKFLRILSRLSAKIYWDITCLHFFVVFYLFKLRSTSLLDLGNVWTPGWRQHTNQGTQADPSLDRRQERKKIQTHYSFSLAHVWSKSSEFDCVSRENN